MRALSYWQCMASAVTISDVSLADGAEARGYQNSLYPEITSAHLPGREPSARRNQYFSFFIVFRRDEVYNQVLYVWRTMLLQK